MSMTLWAAVSGVALGFAGMAHSSATATPLNQEPTASNSAGEVVADTLRARADVKGMHCVMCADAITAMLRRTAGVMTVEVSVEREEAVVDYDPAVTSPAAIVDVINRMGYRATLKKQDGTED